MKKLLKEVIKNHGARNVAAPEFTEDLINDIFKILKENNVVVHTDEYPKENYLDNVEIVEKYEPDDTVVVGDDASERKVFENTVNMTPIPLDDNFGKDNNERFLNHRIATRDKMASVDLSSKKLEDLNPDYALRKIEEERELNEGVEQDDSVSVPEDTHDIIEEQEAPQPADKIEETIPEEMEEVEENSPSLRKLNTKDKKKVLSKRFGRGNLKRKVVGRGKKRKPTTNKFKGGKK